MSHRLAPTKLSAFSSAGIALVLAVIASIFVPATAANAATAGEWAATTYGSFAPVTLMGRGDSVVALPVGARAGYITASHTGRSNFIVHSLDSSNATVEYVFNEIGAFTGAETFGTYSFYIGRASRLSIEADGNWSLTVSPFSQASELPTSGVGSGVYLYSGLAADLTLSHAGRSNFSVWFYGSGEYNSDLLVNEIGIYNGTVPLGAGPAVIAIDADGAWTASRRELAPPAVTPPVVVAPPYVFPPTTTTPTVTTPTVKVTAPNKPKKPRITTKTKSSVKVVWSKPNNGGAAITKYKLRLYKGSKLVKTVTVKASNRAAKFSKLKSKTGYKISVQAGNKLGYSKVSNKVSLKTL